MRTGRIVEKFGGWCELRGDCENIRSLIPQQSESSGTASDLEDTITIDNESDAAHTAITEGGKSQSPYTAHRRNSGNDNYLDNAEKRVSDASNSVDNNCSLSGDMGTEMTNSESTDSGTSVVEGDEGESSIQLNSNSNNNNILLDSASTHQNHTGQVNV